MLAAALLYLATAMAIPITERPVEHPKRTCSGSTVRKEWNNLSEPEKQGYLAAEQCLFTKQPMSGLAGSLNLLEDLANIHTNMSANIHGVGQFLPWHRYMLHAHESLLQSECGYTGPMPWWDETKDAGNFTNSPLLTASYFGSGAVGAAGADAPCVQNGVS